MYSTTKYDLGRHSYPGSSIHLIRFEYLSIITFEGGRGTSVKQRQNENKKICNWKIESYFPSCQSFSSSRSAFSLIIAPISTFIVSIRPLGLRLDLSPHRLYCSLHFFQSLPSWPRTFVVVVSIFIVIISNFVIVVRSIFSINFSTLVVTSQFSSPSFRFSSLSSQSVSPTPRICRHLLTLRLHCFQLNRGHLNLLRYPLDISVVVKFVIASL